MYGNGSPSPKKRVKIRHFDSRAREQFMTPEKNQHMDLDPLPPLGDHLAEAIRNIELRYQFKDLDNQSIHGGIYHQLNSSYKKQSKRGTPLKIKKINYNLVKLNNKDEAEEIENEEVLVTAKEVDKPVSPADFDAAEIDMMSLIPHPDSVFDLAAIQHHEL